MSGGTCSMSLRIALYTGPTANSGPQAAGIGPIGTGSQAVLLFSCSRLGQQLHIEVLLFRLLTVNLTLFVLAL